MYSTKKFNPKADLFTPTGTLGGNGGDTKPGINVYVDVHRCRFLDVDVCRCVRYVCIDVYRCL